MAPVQTAARGGAHLKLSEGPWPWCGRVSRRTAVRRRCRFCTCDAIVGQKPLELLARYWAVSTDLRNAPDPEVSMPQEDGDPRSPRARSCARGDGYRYGRVRTCVGSGGRSRVTRPQRSGVSPPLGVRWFRRSGGMPPMQFAPSSRSPAGRAPTLFEREEIALERVRCCGIRAIARKLGGYHSTILPEIRRNSAPRRGIFDYRAINAQWHADRAAERPSFRLCGTMFRTACPAR